MNPLQEAIKKLAQERAKYIEDYVKFWLAVNVELLETITPEVFAKDYHLLEKHFEDGAIAYQMLPHNEMVIDKKEYERLKQLDENVKKKLEEFKTLLNCGFPCQQDMIELFEELYE